MKQTLANTGYLVERFQGKLELVHRVLWFKHYNYWPSYIDHIDGNKLNNSFENLRECTNAQNAYNSKTPKSNTSGFKGVSLDKRYNKWAAYIRFNYRRKGLGYFNTKEEAARAYNQAAIQYFGEFAKLNELNNG